MVLRNCLVLLILTFIGLSVSPIRAQHAHGSKTAPPKVFLDKSPKIVEYQLSRLSNEQLLMIETKEGDAKFQPVFQAILNREGMDKASRISALNGLVQLSQRSKMDQLVDSLLALKKKDSSYERVVKSLSEVLMESLPEKLDANQESLLKLIDQTNYLSEVGYAALASRDFQAANQMAREKNQLENFLRCTSLIPSTRAREQFRELSLATIDDENSSAALRKSALVALSAMSSDNQTEVTASFASVAKLVTQSGLQNDVVRTLLAIMPEKPPQPVSQTLCKWIVETAETSSAEVRATEAFLDVQQLAEKLLPTIDATAAKEYRQRLSKTSVRVVRIKTVEEQMRYDTPFFAVQAGTDLQIVLSNVDIMPHNLVIVKPDGLKEVALSSATAGPEIGPSGKQYVAHDDRVLYATNMVPAFDQESLTIKAPNEPGEYPYVCTFPGHWMRMYGVMVVVNDLDSWLQNPTKPKDPVGNNRQFVKSWTIEDFAMNLDADLRGRSSEIGQRLFTEASCASCHKAGPALQQGNIGPDLSQSLSKWKGDRVRVLREILEPSYHIDPAYAMHVVVTDSATISGVLVEENDKSISLLESVQATKPTLIERDAIEAHQKSSTSMMPKALLDQYSRDEVLEIMGFILSIQK